MTNEQAIKNIQELKHCLRTCLPRDKVEALDMAIEALKDERPKGHWIHYQNKHGIIRHECSVCGDSFTTNDTYDMYYCSNCGADMRGEICGYDVDYAQAVTQLEYDIQYDSTYNPEDGSA